MLGQGEPYGLECVSGIEELASVSGDEEENGLTFALYVVQGKNNFFSLCKVYVFENAFPVISKL